jgi:hypothetical protein
MTPPRRSVGPLLRQGKSPRGGQSSAPFRMPLNLFRVSLTPGRPAVFVELKDAKYPMSQWALLHLEPRRWYVGALATPVGFAFCSFALSPTLKSYSPVIKLTLAKQGLISPGLEFRFIRRVDFSSKTAEMPGTLGFPRIFSCSSLVNRIKSSRVIRPLSQQLCEKLWTLPRSQ